MPPHALERLFSYLGLARRAGILLVGQDAVKERLYKEPLLLLLADDCSPNVKECMKRAMETTRGSVIELDGVCREKIGLRCGISSAQIVGLPLGSGFARRILSLCMKECDAHE